MDMEMAQSQGRVKSESDLTIDATISAEEIFEIVRQLPAGYRVVFNLVVIEGYSHKEASEMLGITESTSRSQLTHARIKLKQLLTHKGWN
jgi:RNA polymerase sigma-70 factor (ECF subfamily)